MWSVTVVHAREMTVTSRCESVQSLATDRVERVVLGSLKWQWRVFLGGFSIHTKVVGHINPSSDGFLSPTLVVGCVSETDNPIGDTTHEVERRDDVFEVGYECGNCGRQWSQSYPRRTEVNDEGPDAGTYVLLPDNDFGDNRINCPTCGLYTYVGVIERRPIEDGDDE